MSSRKRWKCSANSLAYYNALRPFLHYCGGYAGAQHWGAATCGDNGGGITALMNQLNLGMSGFVNTSCDMLSGENDSHATQTFGDLAHGHPHVHAIVSDDVFSKNGDFTPVPGVDLSRCVILWRRAAHRLAPLYPRAKREGKNAFDLLLQKEKITEEVVDSMCQWSHSGFGIDNSVHIEADDQVGLQRLTENEKDSAFMEKLAQGLTKLNELNIRHPSGATYEFKLD